MPFTLSQQTKGGSHPATATQKTASRDWIMANRPWLKSTGAISEEGKAKVSFNAYKSYFQRIIKADQVADFKHECDATERFLQLLKRSVESNPDIYFKLKLRRRFGGEGQEAFAIFDIRVQLMPKETGVDQVWQKLDALVRLRSLLNL